MARRDLTALLLLCLVGCAEERVRELEPEHTGVDGGVDAAQDSGVATPIDARAAACEQEQTFIQQHRACSVDADCAIAGSCGGGFGFQAVQRAVLAEAQGLSDRTACVVVNDGPTYNAVCERGLCVPRPNGKWCGGAPLVDGAVPGCPNGMEHYRTDCDRDAQRASPTCERRCTGATDTSCGTAQTCSIVRVSAVSDWLGERCGELLDVWLCRAPNP